MADAALTTDSLSVTMWAHLRMSWARIALKHEAMARAARQEMQASSAEMSVTAAQGGARCRAHW